ncbi:MAG: GMP synthase [Croceitalea sp.]|nr:GMP synthase [Croceitalea sp.]
MKKKRIAILDMNANEPNQGLACIVGIAKKFEKQAEYQVFDVRGANEIPDLSFDIYLSSGGPGSPLQQEPWRDEYLDLIQHIWDSNTASSEEKKYVFLICFSYQTVCDYFKLGTIKKRKSVAYGIFPIHKTKKGKFDHLLDALDDPFYAIDSRDWQLVQPKKHAFKRIGATALCLEKIRPHVPLERAVMAVRFSDEIVGTQFHPEAEPIGMKTFFLDEKNKKVIEKKYGKRKYKSMVAQIDDPDKILKTYNNLVPRFIALALDKITAQPIS